MMKVKQISILKKRCLLCNTDRNISGFQIAVDFKTKLKTNHILEIVVESDDVIFTSKVDLNDSYPRYTKTNILKGTEFKAGVGIEGKRKSEKERTESHPIFVPELKYNGVKLKVYVDSQLQNMKISVIEAKFNFFDPLKRKHVSKEDNIKVTAEIEKEGFIIEESSLIETVFSMAKLFDRIEKFAKKTRQELIANKISVREAQKLVKDEPDSEARDFIMSQAPEPPEPEPSYRGPKNLTKAELISLVAKDTNLTKFKTEKAVNAAMQHIKESLAKGKNVTLIGFGTFTTAKRAARTGRNPQTGKKMNIPAKVIPRFRPGKNLSNAVGGVRGKKKK